MLYPAPQIRLYFHDNNGHPLSGGSVSTYLSESSMPIQTAKDYKGKVKNPTTVPLDERGEAVVFLSPGIVYRIVVRDRFGATILDQDGISLPTSGTDSGITYEFQSSDGSISIEATTEGGLITYDFTISTKPLNLSFTPEGSQQPVKLSYAPATGADWSIKNLTITQDGKELGEYSPMSFPKTIDIPKPIDEYDSLADFPETGEEGKIYVARDTNLTYRWTGTQYVEIAASVVPQVNSDWAEEDPSKKSFIKNKIVSISDAEIEALED